MCAILEGADAHVDYFESQVIGNLICSSTSVFIVGSGDLKFEPLAVVWGCERFPMYFNVPHLNLLRLTRNNLFAKIIAFC